MTPISFVLAEGDRNSLDITFVHVPTGSTAKGGRGDGFATRYRSALMRRRYAGWAPSRSHSLGGVLAPFLLLSLLPWYAGYVSRLGCPTLWMILFKNDTKSRPDWIGHVS